MLRSMNDLEDYAIRATDGIIGQVKDFYFDDEALVIHYLVVDTGTWLSSRKVLTRSAIRIGRKRNCRSRSLPDVQVAAFKGNVQLSGFVLSEDQKSSAETIAKGVPGVVKVENSIALKH